MRLRPAPAHWFETYVPCNETVHALEALAATGVAQLELDPKLTEPLELGPVYRVIERFQYAVGVVRIFHPLPASRRPDVQPHDQTAARAE